MADGAKAITRAQEDVFSECEECSRGSRLMCWPHVHRNLKNKIKSVNNNKGSKLLKDIEFLQWSAVSMEVFKQLFHLIKEKFTDGDEEDEKLLTFLEYVEQTWVSSTENRWFEGANPYGLCNNQGLEGKNLHIKNSYTFRRLMALGAFIDTSLQLVHEMSLEDSTLLSVEKTGSLFGQTDSLKLRTNGYEWYQNHQANTNYVSIKPQGRKTQVSNCDTLWFEN